jgi:hypothetical protein
MLLLGGPGEGVAQSEARVGVTENFRQEPNGVVLARVSPDTRVTVRDRRGGWTQVDLEGWMWVPSLQVSAEPGFELVVSASGGENLRAAPSGDVLATLEEGTLLEELGREPGWAHVRRTGWIWSASLRSVAVAGSASGQTGSPGAAASSGSASSAGASDATLARQPGGFATLGQSVAILTAPGGDTLAVTRSGGDAQLLGREGNWVRVRVDGWAWMPSTAPSAAAPSEAPPSDSSAALTPALLASEGDRHVGRVVEWTLQFISLERAEAVRTDFFEGEAFLLTRFGGAGGAFVYVAIPPNLVSQVDGLAPLEVLRVTGRVRKAAADLTGSPILDLVSLERPPAGHE